MTTTEVKEILGKARSAGLQYFKARDRYRSFERRLTGGKAIRYNGTGAEFEHNGNSVENAYCELSDRVNVVTFDRHFGDDERDLGLKDRLKSQENISGLFNWCLEGLRLYKSEGLKPPNAVIVATSEYKNSSDRLAMFIGECLIAKPMQNCKVSDAFCIYIVIGVRLTATMPKTKQILWPVCAARTFSMKREP